MQQGLALDRENFGLGQCDDIRPSGLCPFADYCHFAEAVADNQQVKNPAILGDLQFALGKEAEEILL